MGLLQAAYRTYDSIDKKYTAGKPNEKATVLTPISHTIQNAQLEITISAQGEFVSAARVPKESAETLIPVTEKSASRSGTIIAPHPLAEQLDVVSGIDKVKLDAYLEQLSEWVNSQYGNEKARAVLSYVSGATILDDLSCSGCIELDEKGGLAKGRIEGKEYEKCLIRWLVVPSEVNACWEDIELINSFTAFYESKRKELPAELCMITGECAVSTSSNPKGTVKYAYGAKLVSANDSSGFTYRGRFVNGSQAASISYVASQKAHSALKWLISNYGVTMGNRTFLCWNPKCKSVPVMKFDDLAESSQEWEENKSLINYKAQLRESLLGHGRDINEVLEKTDSVIVAAFEAATTGRLSTTYYNELKGGDFLERLIRWYDSFCWITPWGIQSPSLARVVKCAFGNQRGNFIEVDSKVLGEHVQRLFHCMIDSQPLPVDIVKAVAERCNSLITYSKNNRETMLFTACALIRKQRNDIKNKEVWTLSLDENNKNRSYLFGRLLAIAEKVERDTYDRDENREPNAMRMQSVFSQRPMYAWDVLENQLNPYYAKLSPPLRQYYKRMIQEISDKISADDENLNSKLEDLYILGYYHQRSKLYTKKETTTQSNKEE